MTLQVQEAVMRRLFAALIPILVIASALPAAALAQAPLTLAIDTSVRIGFAGKARDVVVANPMVADVTILDSGGAIIQGREYGQTTITAYDEFGRTVFTRRVVVSSTDDNRVTYFRGAEMNNYTCANTCERTPMPGEPSTTTDDTSSYSSYSSRQRQAAQAANSN